MINLMCVILYLLPEIWCHQIKVLLITTTLDSWSYGVSTMITMVTPLSYSPSVSVYA